MLTVPFGRGWGFGYDHSISIVGDLEGKDNTTFNVRLEYDGRCLSAYVFPTGEDADCDGRFDQTIRNKE